MAKKGPSTFIVIFLCLTLGLAGGAAAIWALLTGQHEGDLSMLRMELQQKETTIAEVRQQSQKAKARLEQLESERSELEMKVGKLSNDLKAAQTDLERTTEQLADSQDRYDRLSAQQSRIEEELSVLQEELQFTEKVADEAQSIQETLNRQLRKYRNRYTILDRDYSVVVNRLKELEKMDRRIPQRIADSSEMSSGATTLPIVLDTQQSSAVRYQPTLDSGERSSYVPTPQEIMVELDRVIVNREQESRRRNINGSIVEVDVPNQFIVIDRGSRDGVSVGMEFDVMHGVEQVGKLRVIRTRNSLSACDIIDTASSASITPGDTVVYMQDKSTASNEFQVSGF